MNIKALAAKNLSGLIRKIESYNETTISQKTVKVNVSSAISQVQSLLNKINALPRSKTVTVTTKYKTEGTPSSYSPTYTGVPQSLEPNDLTQTSRFVSETLNSRLRTVEGEKAAYNESLEEGVSSPVASQVNSKFDAEISRLSDTTRRINDGFYKTFEELISDTVIFSVLGSTTNLGFGQMFKSDEFDKVAKVVNDYVKNMPDMTSKINSAKEYTPSTNINNSSVHFDSPLVVVEGNASEDIINSLESVSDKLIRKIVKEVEKTQNRTKRLEGRS